MKSAIIAIVCYFSIAPIFSQFSISGTLKDQHDEVLPFATVLLMSEDSTMQKGVISNVEGDFLIMHNTIGNYFLSISAVGFEETFTEIFALDETNGNKTFSEITVVELVKRLDEVVVATKRPFFEQKIDRTVVNVESNIAVAGGTALDVLQRSPGVTVNSMSNSIALSGKEGVRVMINGKLSRLPQDAIMTMLAGMNAENIEKIELITTPPAKYEAEGDAGMINIVLKKGEDQGFNGSSTTFAGYGRRAKYGSSINFNLKEGKVNLYGDYSFADRHQKGYWNSDRTIQVDGDEIFTDVVNGRPSLTRVHNGRLGIDLELSDKTTIGAFSSINSRHWDMGALADIRIDTNDVTTSVLKMQTNEINESLLIISNLNLTHQINNDQSISLDLDYIDYDSDNPTEYIQNFFTPSGQLENVDLLRSGKVTPISTWVGKLDYSFKIGEVNFEMGGKGSFSYLENDILVEDFDNNVWEVDNELSSDAQMHEDIYAGYISSRFKLSEKLEGQAGLRYEHTLTDLDTRTEQNVVLRDFGNWFPSVFLQRKITEEMSFVASYSRRVTRPSFFQIAPFVIFSDPNSFFSGNERLLPSFTDQFKLEYRFKSYLISLQYSYDENAITLFQPEINEENQSVNTAQNLDYRRNYAVNISFPISIADWWEIQSNVSWSRVTVRASFTDNPFEATINNLNINGNSRFTLPKKWTAEISGFYAAPSYFGVAKLEALGAIYLGIEKKFTNSNIRFTVNDPFLTSTWRWRSSIPEENINQGGYIDFEFRTVRLAYTFSFGNNKVKRRYRNSASQEEQGRYQQ